MRNVSCVCVVVFDLAVCGRELRGGGARDGFAKWLNWILGSHFVDIPNLSQGEYNQPTRLGVSRGGFALFCFVLLQCGARGPEI